MLSVNNNNRKINCYICIFPANLLIITLFKKAGPKIEKVDKGDLYEDEDIETARGKTPISSSNIVIDEKSGLLYCSSKCVFDKNSKSLKAELNMVIF